MGIRYFAIYRKNIYLMLHWFTILAIFSEKIALYICKVNVFERLVMLQVPSYYRADDLLLQALYDEGCKICHEHPDHKTHDYPNDSFHHSDKKELLKKGLTIGSIIAGLGTLAYGAIKLLKKFKKP